MNPSNEHREREGKLGQKYTTFFNLCRMMSYERLKHAPRFLGDQAGGGPGIQKVVKLIEKVADNPLNVLITGESGKAPRF
jgi:transcriptional regulator with PAS, ATPase and Fis domain